MFSKDTEYARKYGGAGDEHESVQISDLIAELDHVYTSSLLSIRLHRIKYGFVYTLYE